MQVIDIDVTLLDKPFCEYMRSIRKDKKQESDALTAVLITAYGDTGELSVVHDITEDEIRSAIDYFISIYGEKE